MNGLAWKRFSASLLALQDCTSPAELGPALIKFDASASISERALDVGDGFRTRPKPDDYGRASRCANGCRRRLEP
jgi:hypothetical protein